MKTSEIIKGLRICGRGDGCQSCPLENHPNTSAGNLCDGQLMRDAADALEKLNDFEHRQLAIVMAENSRLKAKSRAPANTPLTLDELRKMDGDWVWLIDAKHPEYIGWYNVRPFHDGSGGIKLYGIYNDYYERAVTSGSVKVYARKPEGSETT